VNTAASNQEMCFSKLVLSLNLYAELFNLVTTPVRYSKNSVYLVSVKLIIVSGRISYCEVQYVAVWKRQVSRTVTVLKYEIT
jgi:hypothetical protein